MPRYRFTHPFAEVFFDLTHGKDTVVHRAVEVEDPLGSTVVLQPGDELTTKKKYPHAHLATIKSDGSDEWDSSDDEGEAPSEESGESEESDETPADDASNEPPAEQTTDEVKE